MPIEAGCRQAACEALGWQGWGVEAEAWRVTALQRELIQRQGVPGMGRHHQCDGGTRKSFSNTHAKYCSLWNTMFSKIPKSISNLWLWTSLSLSDLYTVWLFPNDLHKFLLKVGILFVCSFLFSLREICMRWGLLRLKELHFQAIYSLLKAQTPSATAGLLQ